MRDWGDIIRGTKEMLEATAKATGTWNITVKGACGINVSFPSEITAPD